MIDSRVQSQRLVDSLNEWMARAAVAAAMMSAVWALNLNSSQITAADELRVAAVKRSAHPTFKPIDAIELPKATKPTELPIDESTELFSAPQPASRQVLGRTGWASRDYQWTAPEFHHHPLYFDDVPLERYGQSATAGWQPLISAAHFYRDAALLPYSVVANPPRQRVSTLGYFRPGSPTPPLRQTQLAPRHVW